jgi:hypothetical protein
MASAFSHAAAALALGSVFRWERTPYKYWVAGSESLRRHLRVAKAP